ncbi:MAG: antitoxin component YwqK of YwqJK toxin-antitoxin module [Flavobacteriales bacterium]|jgi:antitoxin component YwqK of YwqJK toxin-antitoxin module
MFVLLHQLMNCFKLILLVLFTGSTMLTLAQSDTLNQVDENGKKAGYWIITGGINATSGYGVEDKIEEGEYKRSRKMGVWTKYHSNGNIKSKAEYTNGRASGPFETYFETGVLEEKGTWKGGRYQGGYEMFYPDGSPRQKKTFNESGATEGTVTLWHPNGQKEIEFETINGQENGTATWWYENGDKKKEQTFTNGVSNGPAKEFAREKPKYVDPDKKPVKKGPKITGKFNGNSGLDDCYGKTYDNDKNILMDGCFKDDRLFDGRHYIYDEYGLLDHIDVYKEGEFAGNGVIGAKDK